MGDGERRTLRTAARHADEWNGWCRPDEMIAKRAVLARHCEAAGRDVADIRCSTQAFVCFTDGSAAHDDFVAATTGRPTLVGTADQIVEQVAAHADAGADELIVPLATFYFNPSIPDWDGQAVHDVCAVAFVARPDLFRLERARVDIETTGEFTTGMTVVDFDPPLANASVATKLDVAGFWAYVESVYARVAAEHLR